MTEIGQASFSFSGSSGSTFVKTQSFPGTIIDNGVTLVHHTSSGSANHTMNWRQVGSLLEVRCTFWGWGGSSARVSAGFNVYYEPGSRAASTPHPELHHEVLTVDFEGEPGQSVERCFTDLAGDVEAVELLGRAGDGAEEIEVERVGPREIVVRARLAEGAKGPQQETVYVAASLRAA